VEQHSREKTPAAPEGLGRIFPLHRLPDRFLLSVDDPPTNPAFPEPSATLVLVREGSPSLEVLLLKRTPRSGFIPGAWVFPGGRVDREDGSPPMLALVKNRSEGQARARLSPEPGEPPALAYWVAAARETFEETGVLPGAVPDDVPDLLRESGQERLLSGQNTFRELLMEAGGTLDGSALRYIGHWLTPECEPRRYQTRFFMTQVERDSEVRPHEAEMVDHLWLTPSQALDRNRAGDLPMVLPTIYTLEELRQYAAPEEAMEGLATATVPRRLPVPQRVEGGIRFLIPG